MIIYKITNEITKKAYIGQTTRSLKERWSEHCSHKKNNYFRNAIKKYGSNVWFQEILEEINDINLLNEREIYWISYYDTFNNGYNLTSGGNQATDISLETRERMRLSQLGRKHSEETRKKMSKATKGTKLSSERLEKNRISHIGIKRSDDSKRKQSLAVKGIPKSEDFKEKMRKPKSEETKKKRRS